jgi:glycosidase
MLLPPGNLNPRKIVLINTAMRPMPTFEFHVSRSARDHYEFDQELFSWTGNVLFANIAASRRFAEQMNRKRDIERHPERTVHPGALNAMALIDEMLHALIARYREERDPSVMVDALGWFEGRLGRGELDKTLLEFVQEFPPKAVYQGKGSAPQWLDQATDGMPHRAIAMEELMMLWLENANPAFRRFRELFDDDGLKKTTAYPKITSELKRFFQDRPGYGPENINLVDLLRAPALAAPESLEGQLAYMREKWPSFLGDMLRRILVALDIFKEEERAIWMQFHPPSGAQRFGHQHSHGDSSAAAIPHFNLKEPEYERFSPDVEWMPRTVMIAKSAFVWLDQLSKTYKRPIARLDQIPDEELDTLARRGFNALWLIGLWERSTASRTIKQLMGNPEAAASAYSLFDYVIADDLGGESAFLNFRERAIRRGIRLGSDMVPNHMGIDSRWVMENPDRFLSLSYPPFPAYGFEGPDLSSDDRVEIKIEDHYYTKTDAAVVFRRRDRWTGDTRYVYHGNDGTSYPWNDTAQLNYLNPEVREAVIQKILYVARLSPIIRFDAAMTLAKQHYQRLWFPVPGTGGAIPSRAEHGLTKPEFDAAMPNEFWREVVDRVAAEAPGTLLLAEAFWLLEGYFVRTLGMHRVYNSAFMNMLRDEENANYRGVIKKTIEFDSEILKRYVNFMNNPDERTAVDQFGKGDKYFGVCTLMSTLPGLPMFGHGQVEGFGERYGMEYRRAYQDETPDHWFIARHEREIAPLLYRRPLFAEVQNFLLYDFFTDSGSVNEDVFAYSNRLSDQRALVIFNNRYNSTRGWVRISSAYADKLPDGNRSLRQRTLAEAFGVAGDPDSFLAARDNTTGLEHLYSGRELAEKGMQIELGGYQSRVLLDWRDLRDDAKHPWRELYDHLRGKGVPSLSDAIGDLRLKPVHEALSTMMDPRLSQELAMLIRNTGKPVPAEKLGDKQAQRVRTDGERSRKRVKPTPDQALPPAAETAASPNSQPINSSPTDVIAVLTTRMKKLLEIVERFATGGPAELLGVPPREQWRGEADEALLLFAKSVRAATKLPGMQAQFVEPWSKQACEVLPTRTATGAAQLSIWASIIAWAAIRSMGDLIDPVDPDKAGARLFDALRLRTPIADALEKNGFEGEARWRAAARVRVVLADQSWLPGARRPAGAPFAWLHDPDVAWLIDVHEHEGMRYFNKEMFECLLWWMALPVLVRIAGQEEVSQSAIRRLEAQIQSRTEAARNSAYQVTALLEMPQDVDAEAPSLKVSKDEPQQVS